MPRLAAAAFSDLTRGTSQGASTIPMQLAKILYLSNSQNFRYKIQQIALAERLSNSTSRAVILDALPQRHLLRLGRNGHPGRGAHVLRDRREPARPGAGGDARGHPQQPHRDDPHLDPAAAAARQHQVLDAMVDTGAITLAGGRLPLRERLVYAAANPDNVNVVPFFTARVVKSVWTTWHLDALTAGLRITSTLDSALQQFTQRAVSSQIAQLGRPPCHRRCGGRHRSRIGRRARVCGQRGRERTRWSDRHGRSTASTRIVVQDLHVHHRHRARERQHGDAGARRALDAAHRRWPERHQPYSPLDYDRTWHGILPVEEALGNSLNIPAIRVEMATGIPAIVATARAMGVTTLGRSSSSRTARA